MYHTCAYTASFTNSQTNATLVALADNVFRIGSQNGFVLQENMMLLMSIVLNNNGTGARLNAPKFAQFGPIQLLPLVGGPKVTSGILIGTWPYRAPTFRNQEEVYCTYDSGGTAAAQETVVVSFANSVDPIPPGEELTFKITSTTAAVANTWTLLTYSFSQTLPEGLYAMISSEMVSTNAQAHRWTFWNQFYRPGMPSTTAQANPEWGGVRDYRMGLMGQFSNVTPPNLEVLANGTDNSHTGFIRAIKVA
jgi:hypothetical protein